MKTLLFFLISFSCIAQDVEIYQEGELVQRVNSTSFELNEKKILLSTNDYKLELSVIKKESKSKWICTNENGTKYTVTAKAIAGVVVVIFEPESTGLLKFVLFIDE